MPYSEAWSVSACWGDSKGNDLQKNQGYSPVYCLKDTSPGLKEQPHMAADRLKGGFLPPKICNLCNHVSLPSWWNYPFAIQSSQLWFYSWQCFLHFPFFPSSNNHVEQIFCYFSFIAENRCPSYWRILWPDVRYIKKFGIWIYFILSVKRITQRTAGLSQVGEMFRALFPGLSADCRLPQRLASGVTPSLSGLAA